MLKYSDTYRHKGLRKKLVEKLIEGGIKDKNVLNAINNIPRHCFLDKAFEEQAYQDKALPIDEDQTISRPLTVAWQTQLLNIKRNDKILEIGTGSGFQAAVLAQYPIELYSIERIEKLYLFAADIFKQLSISDKVHNILGDGFVGLPDEAPFDKIIITAALDVIPETLLSQLKIGGICVFPFGKHGEAQTMIRLTKTEAFRFTKEQFGDCQFVPMLSGIKKK